jgi:hypothetical protein
MHSIHSLIPARAVFQIRVVNAFQEPSATPAQLPYKGRPSFASLVSMAARTISTDIPDKQHAPSPAAAGAGGDHATPPSAAGNKVAVEKEHLIQQQQQHVGGVQQHGGGGGGVVQQVADGETCL